MQLLCAKDHEGHERRYLYSRVLQSYVLFLGDHVYLKLLCTMTTVT
jgi:hypothetical protein